MSAPRVLVANRGEIALRIVRACRELGYRSIVTYSRGDRDTLPVKLADGSVCIGPPDPTQSYLDVDAVLAAADFADVDAVHPGYGLLSENADFAREVERAGYTFVGPAPETMELMGQKAEARRQLASHGVPVLPGSDGKLRELSRAEEVAADVGFPLMVKAASGGGGRGIAKVENINELREQFPRVQSEAEAAFGSDWMYLEKFIENPRHIELQVLGDGRGNVLHFYERECSIQRRHQKLLEEAPSPVLSPDKRRQLTSSVTSALGKMNYRNAGTVEFVSDSDGNAHVIEVNTRIQVEHPVTEMICGVDLVALQLQTAINGEVPLEQDDIDYRGHAVEARICAEDPASGFAPQQGVLEALHLPGGTGVRVDTYLESGSWISPHYDSMLGKLICWHHDRDACLDRLWAALDEFKLSGVRTTIPLFKWLIDQPDFRRGKFHTGYLDGFDLEQELA